MNLKISRDLQALNAIKSQFASLSLLKCILAKYKNSCIGKHMI